MSQARSAALIVAVCFAVIYWSKSRSASSQLPPAVEDLFAAATSWPPPPPPPPVEQSIVEAIEMAPPSAAGGDDSDDYSAFGPSLKKKGHAVSGCRRVTDNRGKVVVECDGDDDEGGGGPSFAVLLVFAACIGGVLYILKDTGALA